MRHLIREFVLDLQSFNLILMKHDSIRYIIMLLECYNIIPLLEERITD